MDWQVRWLCHCLWYARRGFAHLPVCDHSQVVYFPPNRRQNKNFRVLFQQTNKRTTNKQTNKHSSSHKQTKLVWCSNAFRIHFQEMFSHQWWRRGVGGRPKKSLKKNYQSHSVTLSGITFQMKSEMFTMRGKIGAKQLVSLPSSSINFPKKKKNWYQTNMPKTCLRWASFWQNIWYRSQIWRASAPHVYIEIYFSCDYILRQLRISGANYCWNLVLWSPRYRWLFLHYSVMIMKTWRKCSRESEKLCFPPAVCRPVICSSRSRHVWCDTQIPLPFCWANHHVQSFAKNTTCAPPWSLFSQQLA